MTEIESPSYLSLEKKNEDMSKQQEERRNEIRSHIQKMQTLTHRLLGIDELSEKYNVSRDTILRDISHISKNISIDERVGLLKKEVKNNNGETYEEIWVGFYDKTSDDKEKYTVVDLLFFPNRQIATIIESYEDPETGDIQDRTIELGMTKDELEYFFPARSIEKTRWGATYNLRSIIRSIIYEAYIKEGLKGTIDGGDVRHFWYTHLKPVLLGKLGCTETDSLIGTMNEAWKAMIESGLATYEDMSIIGGKETSRISVVKDSPFSNIIIAVEKLNFFETFKWIPQLFNCTLYTSGGTPSRAVTRRFIYELNKLGVDLNQDFHMCVCSDLDPAGYNIQQSFSNQLESAIKYYDGRGKIIIHRLFIRKDQVTSSLLESQGMPWRPTTRSKKEKKHLDMLKKMNDTIWNGFCERTGGGLYIPKPDGWDASDVFNEDTIIIDGKPMVRALLEMDAFSTPIIEKSIIKEILKIIRATSDETKIIIPEIMRVLEHERLDVIEELYLKWKNLLIEPLKKQFLEDTTQWDDEIQQEREKALYEINQEYEEYIAEQEELKRERVPELFHQKEEIEKNRRELREQIQKLDEEIQSLDDDIIEKCEDIEDEISDLNDKKNDEERRIYDIFTFRNKRLAAFKDEQLLVFNPVEQALKNDISTRLSDTYLPFRFNDLENNENTRKCIASLCTNSKLLLDKKLSCFYHPPPAFKVENLLEQAALNKETNVGNVRDSLPSDFHRSIKDIIRENANQIQFELTKTIEMKDLQHDIAEAKQRTEQELQNFLNEEDY